jgi:hypothetical protein
MARRRKKSRRRGPKTVSLINLAESLAYANIITYGAFGTDAWNFATGKDDLKLLSSATYEGVYQTALDPGYASSTGADKITLREFMSNPTVSMAVTHANLTNNWQSMVIQSFGVSISARLFKKLLRKPIANVNRNIFKNLGIGVRL